MQHLGTIDQREIHYLHKAGEIVLPGEKNWLVLIVADQYKAKVHRSELETVVQKQPLFIYCCCNNFQDMEDDVVNLLCDRFMEEDDAHDEDADNESPLTFAENDLAASLDFCLNHAFHDTQTIEHVVVLDLRNKAELTDIKKLAGL